MEQKLKSMAEELGKMKDSIGTSLELNKLNHLRDMANDVITAARSLSDKVIRLRMEKQ